MEINLENIKTLIVPPTVAQLTPAQQNRVTDTVQKVDFLTKQGAFGSKVSEKIRARLVHATDGEHPGDLLDAAQCSAVIQLLKETKEIAPGTELSIGIKARLAGSILSALGDVPPGAEKVGAALESIDGLTF